MAALLAPHNVSPLIRFGRYAALSLGILWGISRSRSLCKKEEKLRAIEAVQKPIREAKMAVERKRQIKEELIYLAKETGTPIPKDFDEKY